MQYFGTIDVCSNEISFLATAFALDKILGKPLRADTVEGNAINDA
jgi:hypothetical protein